MSRHRNALGYCNQELDDYYNSKLDDSFEHGCSVTDDEDDDEEDDDEIDDFEERYLKSGIDLNLSSKQGPNTVATQKGSSFSQLPNEQNNRVQQQHLVNHEFSDSLSSMAINHLTQHQWQLPLLEMDHIFRDRTYFKHYADSYSSDSKLGLFMCSSKSSNQSDSHQSDNSNGKKIISILVDHYQNLQLGFFSFSTPSPDEEIAIGCRFGSSKARPMPVKKTKEIPHQQTRFEYSGVKGSNKSSTKSSSTMTPASSSSLVRPNQKFNISRKTKEVPHQHTRFEHGGIRGNQNKSSTKPSTTMPSASSSSLVQPTQKSINLRNTKEVPDQPTKLEHGGVKGNNKISTKSASSSLLVRPDQKSINLIVVGHVDAGKSTLIGHLLFKLGLVSNKLMHRCATDSKRTGKASFKFAWILDETDEERLRGVTMDLASSNFKTQSRDINLIDAPGHSDFIPAVITGAAQADAAILVVDATRGEFETGFANGGQTREHLLLIRALGVKSLIVVVNKMDNVDWDEIRYRHVVEQLKPFIKVVGYNIEKVKFIPCSGLSGDNLTTTLKQTKVDLSHPQLERDWYDGPTLLDCIDLIELPQRDIDKALRLCVTDVFKGMSSGVFLAGSIEGGHVREKQKLLLMPQNEFCEVKTIEIKDMKTEQAFAGDPVTLVVTGIDLAKFFRGSVLCDPSLPTSVSNRFQARIVTFSDIDTILLKGSPIEVHMNGMIESGHVRKLLSLLNKSTGDLIQKRPKCIAKNSSAIIEVITSRVLCVEMFEDYKNLGRFLIRSMGKTIAAGLISKICRPKLEKSDKKHRK